MSSQPTRRVRAGAPPPNNTGCLPVEFTAEQIDAWAKEQHEAEYHADRMFFRRVAAVLVVVAVLAVAAVVIIMKGGVS